MAFIVGKQIELSGTSSAYELKKLWMEGETDATSQREQRMAQMESQITGVQTTYDQQLDMTTQALGQLQEQIALLAQNQSMLIDKLGGGQQPSGNGSAPTPEPGNAPQPNAVPVA
jgi:hypothetical protein